MTNRIVVPGLASALVALSLSGCEDPFAGVECSPARNIVCEAGRTCVDNKCRNVCDSAAQCHSSEACISNACVPYSASCSGPGECAAGWTCNVAAGSCEKLAAAGAACASPSQCISGFCVDSRCCESACEGTCLACSSAATGESDGTCANVSLGLDPQNDCPGGAVCDGQGGCSAGQTGDACSVGAECATGFCADGVCCSASCDGVCMSCLATETGDMDGICAPVLPGLDVGDIDCPGPVACDGAGACFERGTDDACAEAYECITGYCVDGVCCNSACEGVCASCAGGTCGPVSSAPDVGTCSSTEQAGDCSTLPCACDAAGLCSGAPGAVCTSAADCGGNPCLGGICCDGACSGPCSSCNGDYTSGNHGDCAPVNEGLGVGTCGGQDACDGSGVCFGGQLGAACVNAYECESGHCVDGTCCNSACSSLCFACDGVGTAVASPGTCSAIANGQDPAQECPDYASCNGGGVCWSKSLGASCGADYECTSGPCLGGVCKHAAVSVSAGASHTCAILSGGRIKCWGDNESAHLGLGLAHTDDRGDDPGEMGDALPFVDLGSGLAATQLSASRLHHTCAILTGNQVKCWGGNGNGQLGLGDSITRGYHSTEMGDALPSVDLGAGQGASQVSAGGSHTCALLLGGHLKCWGVNSFGTLGLGDTLGRGANPNEMGDSLPIVDLGTGRTAIQVSAGQYHTCALLDNRQVKCWGRNSFGELGTGDTTFLGGHAGDMGDALPAVDLGLGRLAFQVIAGANRTCALLDSGQVKCWGWNSEGQLGLGDTENRGDGPGEMGDLLPPVDLGSGVTALQIAIGGAHTCALLNNSQVKCWGTGTYGRLGTGGGDTRGDEVGEMGDALPFVDLGPGERAAAVSAGGFHSCALLASGKVKCWGSNGSGRLGLGDVEARGDAPGEMGYSLPAVDL